MSATEHEVHEGMSNEDESSSNAASNVSRFSVINEVNKAHHAANRKRVIIRVWTSRWNKSFPGEDVGHISLDVGGVYMSFWPAVPANPKNSIFGAPAEFKGSYEEDLKEEGREPEITLCLYSLNVAAMRTEFREIHSKVKSGKYKGWTVVGNSLLNGYGGGHSCSSLAYEVLKAGQIYDLITSRFSSSLSSAPSPDGLARAVFAAKKGENKNYAKESKSVPEFAGETKLEDFPQNNPRTGLVGTGKLAPVPKPSCALL